MKKLIYFTTYYPNRDVQWKTDEIKILSKHFNIEIIPFENKNFEHKAEKIKGVKYSSPLFNVFHKTDIRKKLLRVIFNKYILNFLSEAIQKKVFFSKTKLILWTEAAYKILMLSKNKKLKAIFSNADKNTIFYFYWGKETSEVLGFLTTKAKIIVRYHGYDLYEERNSNYIPFRKTQLKNLDYAVFVSEQGEKYLKNKYSNIKFKTKLSRLGTQSHGLAKQSEDGIFRIVSCSSVIPLKRVELIAKAVMKLNFVVEWTHIGGGDGFDDLKKQIINLPENIKINLTGQVSANDVPGYYANKQIDLFINASTTEGVPVSVMEAMSADIPVFATNVGGSSEIVNNKNGKLLSADITVDSLKDEITMFYNLPKEKKTGMRKEAYNTNKKLYNAKNNAENLAVFLDNL